MALRRVTWYGEGFSEGGLVHYSGVSIAGNVVSVGDCALVEPARIGDDPFVCRVNDFFDDHVGDRTASVMWFFRFAEYSRVLRQRKRRRLDDDDGDDDDDGKNEAEIYAGHNDLISINSLIKKCRVIVLRNDADIPDEDEDEDGNDLDEQDVFYVRRFFDMKSASFVDARLMNRDGGECSVSLPLILEGRDVLLVREDEVAERRRQAETPGKRKRKLRQSFEVNFSLVTTPRRQSQPKRRRRNDDTDDDNVSDYESDTPRKRKNFLRLPSRSPRTPQTKQRRRTTLTPLRLPSRSTPCTKPRGPLEEAKLKLHASAVPESLPCREREFADVYDFCEERLSSNGSGCMYISGVPGTGKTATVREVVACLERARDDGDLPDFQYIEVNGMKVTEPQQIYPAILKQLTGEKATANHAQDLLLKWFHSPNPRKRAVLLVVDELDLLWTRKQTVMYNLFDWPGHRKSKLVVVAIANTMDLPERIMDKRVQSRMGLTRVSFQPYTHSQLQAIITSRLEGIEAFDSESIELAARKVAAVSGDARRALDICRRAVELATGEDATVTLKHISDAVQTISSSPIIVAMRNCSLYERLFFQAILSVFRKKGIEEATFGEIYKDHASLCHLEVTVCLLQALKLLDAIRHLLFALDSEAVDSFWLNEEKVTCFAGFV
ncbi:origin recognition complex subunit 1-like isoform X2 [Oscarella lobularis]|uniref:origin recognition complex subunit 1-like isoform X2 n=1 Tax=Oscarella lobularis TaxID=121494 RepID=UPI00331322D1